MKTKEILGILMLFLCTFSFISCDDDNEQTNELTPEDFIRLHGVEQGIVRLGQYKIWGRYAICRYSERESKLGRLR